MFANSAGQSSALTCSQKPQQCVGQQGTKGEDEHTSLWHKENTVKLQIYELNKINKHLYNIHFENIV